MGQTSRHSEKGKVMERVRRLVIVRDYGGERNEWAEHRILGHWNCSVQYCNVGTCHNTSVKTHRTHNTRNES